MDFVFVGFSHFANISIAASGARRVVHDGFTFGVFKNYAKSGILAWRCIKDNKDKQTGVRKRCTAIVRTKTIDGYEMLKPSKTPHIH